MPVLTGPRVCARTWVESAADHAREDDEDEGQHLQIGGQNGGSLHMTHVLSRQRSLHNHLRVKRSGLGHEKCFRNPSCLISFSPHSVFSQLLPAARSPGHNEPPKEAKGVEQLNLHRPAGASDLATRGRRDWQPHAPQLPSEKRSGRSPRRHSPGSRNAERTAPPADTSGLLGISLSKLSNLKYLKGRGGASQKRASQNNKAAR